MKANDRAVVNDSPVDCQSREVTEGKFSAENLARTLVQILPPQPESKTLEHQVLRAFFVLKIT